MIAGEGAVRMSRPLEPRVLVICRNPAIRARLRQLLPDADLQTSVLKAVQVVARKTPLRAIVVSLDRPRGNEEAMLDCFRRAAPGVPTYLVVEPDSEPVARDFVGSGVDDYFVTAGGLGQLVDLLYPPEAASDGPAPSGAVAAPPSPPGASGPNPVSVGEAARALTALALRRSGSILSEGVPIVLGALGARRGCAFVCEGQPARVRFARAVGGAGGARDFEAEATFAERIARTGETLNLDATATTPALVCVPVREGTETFGVLCLSEKSDGSRISPADLRTLESLAGALAGIIHVAREREALGLQARRDAETGLLNEDLFRTYLAKVLQQASQRGAEVGLTLIEPGTGNSGPDAASLGRLGRAIRRAIPDLGQGGRLGPARFAVAWFRPTDDAAAAARAHRGIMETLSGVTWDTASHLRLRAGLAVYPHDGGDAEALLAAAEKALASSPT